MANDVLWLGEVAQRTEWIESATNAFGSTGRLHTAKLLALHGPNAAMGDVMRAQVGDCPKSDAGRLSRTPEARGSGSACLSRAPDLGISLSGLASVIDDAVDRHQRGLRLWPTAPHRRCCGSDPRLFVLAIG
jgi:hypothetical protein